MEILYSIAVILTIAGAISVALGKPLIANIVWTYSNTIFIARFAINFDLGMLILFSIYFLIAVFGVINLSIKYKNKRKKNATSNIIRKNTNQIMVR
jgi:mannose/fructose/N-acetylgalactosamine-specific phosphotransferase system component IIC